MVDLDLNVVVETVLQMLQRVLGEHIHVHCHYHPEPLLIRADPGMMDQILLNLTVNARDAMPNGGQLTINTSAVELDAAAAGQMTQGRAGSFVRLSVTDTGRRHSPGILSQDFRTDFYDKEVGKGTGLGLATAFGIVQQHNGWINVTSEVGKGTTFMRLSATSGQGNAEQQ